MPELTEAQRCVAAHLLTAIRSQLDTLSLSAAALELRLDLSEEAMQRAAISALRELENP